MPTLLRMGMKDFEALGPDDPFHTGTQVRFEDEYTARSFLSSVRSEFGSLHLLRSIVWSPGQVPESNEDAIDNFLVTCLMRDTIRIMEPAPLRRAPVELLEEEEAEDETVETSSETEETTWVEIEFIDMIDEPLVGERYIVTLPDGTEKTGRTGPTGIIRVECESADSCDFTFPDLDQEAWEPA